MEADEVEETFTAGPSSERALARVVASSAHRAHCHRCCRWHRESPVRLAGDGCGLSSL